jgi:hypothetical protein
LRAGPYQGVISRGGPRRASVAWFTGDRGR